jgi:hypothetical protein
MTLTLPWLRARLGSATWHSWLTIPSDDRWDRYSLVRERASLAERTASNLAFPADPFHCR